MPFVMPTPHRSHQDNFAAQLDLESVPGCHLWTGRRDERGYGVFAPLVGARCLVQHFARAMRGDDFRRLRNTCGHRHCANPDHWEETRRGRAHTVTQRTRRMEDLSAAELAEFGRRFLDGAHVRSLSLRFGLHPVDAERLARRVLG